MIFIISMMTFRATLTCDSSLADFVNTNSQHYVQKILKDMLFKVKCELLTVQVSLKINIIEHAHIHMFYIH